MKTIYLGNIERNEIIIPLKKRTLWPIVTMSAITILMIILPIVFPSILDGHYEGKGYSNTVLIETSAGTGSGVYIGDNNLITAAHVVTGMDINERCSVIFEQPDIEDGKSIYAEAELVAIGNWSKQNSFDEDYALLHITSFDADKYIPRCILGKSSKVKTQDEITVCGYPAGVYKSTNGIISNIKGEDILSNCFVVSASAWPGSSGGALFDKNKELIGIVTLIGNKDILTNAETYAIKIDHIKQGLKTKGLQL